MVPFRQIYILAEHDRCHAGVSVLGKSHEHLDELDVLSKTLICVPGIAQLVTLFHYAREPAGLMFAVRKLEP
jgi:hypothetical protein